MFVGCKIIIKSKYGMWKGRNTSLLQFFFIIICFSWPFAVFIFFFFGVFRHKRSQSNVHKIIHTQQQQFQKRLYEA